MKGRSGWRPSWAVAALFFPAALLMLTFRGASSSQKMSQTSMAHATATAAGPGPSLADDLPGLQAVTDFLTSELTHVWFLSLVGSVAVGLSGVFPLLVIPFESGAALKTEGRKWKCLFFSFFFFSELGFHLITNPIANCFFFLNE